MSDYLIHIVVAVLVASLALIYFEYRKDIDEAREHISSGSRIAQTNCGPIEYSTAGSGPPVLVVHGAGGGFDQGLAVARLLVEGGFQVIAPSRFGYLRTPMSDNRDRLAETQADAHVCLLDTLRLSKVAVFGVSAGAPSSMRLCLKRPERCSALVLMAPAYPATPTGEQRELSTFARFFLDTTLRSDFIFWALISIAPDTMTRMILATPPKDVKHASPAEQARVRAMLWDILPVSRRADGLRHEAASIANAPGAAELNAIKTPTLLISAENDLFGTYTAAQTMAQQIPNARFIGYPTGGHLFVGATRRRFGGRWVGLLRSRARASEAGSCGPRTLRLRKRHLSLLRCGPFRGGTIERIHKVFASHRRGRVGWLK